MACFVQKSTERRDFSPAVLAAGFPTNYFIFHCPFNNHWPTTTFSIFSYTIQISCIRIPLNYIEEKGYRFKTKAWKFSHSASVLEQKIFLESECELCVLWRLSSHHLSKQYQCWACTLTSNSAHFGIICKKSCWADEACSPWLHSYRRCWIRFDICFWLLFKWPNIIWPADWEPISSR